jgi:hypothetical protein
VHIVGGTIPDCLLAAVRAADASTPVFSEEVPGTRVVREPIGLNVRVAHSASDSVGHTAAHSAA